MDVKSARLKTAAFLLTVFLAAGVFACKKEAPASVSRDLPFTDITTVSSTWKMETCRLIAENGNTVVQGRIRNTGVWPTAGLTMYLRFLDSDGKVLTSSECITVLDNSVESNQTSGYSVPVKNFYEIDRIDSVTVEFGK